MVAACQSAFARRPPTNAESSGNACLHFSASALARSACSGHGFCQSGALSSVTRPTAFRYSRRKAVALRTPSRQGRDNRLLAALALRPWPRRGFSLSISVPAAVIAKPPHRSGGQSTSAEYPSSAQSQMIASRCFRLSLQPHCWSARLPRRQQSPGAA